MIEKKENKNYRTEAFEQEAKQRQEYYGTSLYKPESDISSIRRTIRQTDSRSKGDRTSIFWLRGTSKSYNRVRIRQSGNDRSPGEFRMFNCTSISPS